MTVREIARQAGVAASTVSLVLNNKPGVRRETREKIAAMLLENGYSIRENPSKPAFQLEIKFIRYLSITHSRERNEDFFVGLLNGAEQRAHELGCKFSLSSATPSQLPDLLRMLEEQPDLAGVVFLASELSDEQIPCLLQFSRPLVMLDMPMQLEHYPFNGINTDNSGGIFRAVQRLYDMGHRNIGFLRAETEIGGLYSRYVAYLSAMRSLGLETKDEQVLRIDPQYEIAIRQMQQHLKGHPALPTAFVAANDIIAAGCVRALQQCGYQVPEDVSVVGFDDGAMSTFILPPLTTLRINRARSGQLAVERLMALNRIPDDVIVKSTISVTLIERESARHLYKTAKTPE